MRYIWAICKKDLRDLTRNMTLLLMLLFPIIFGWGLSYLSEPNVNIGVIGPVPDYLEAQDRAGTIVLTEFATEGNLRDALGKSIKVGLLFPYNDPLSEGEIAFTILETRPGDPLGDLIMQLYYKEMGLILPPAAEVIRETVQGPWDMGLQDYSLALAIIMGLTLIGCYLVPTLILEEKEKGTLRAIIASGAGFPLIIASKAITGFALGIGISAFVLIIVSPEKLTIPWYLLFTILGALMITLLGLIMGSLLDSIAALNTLSSFVMIILLLPAILETGLASPLAKKMAAVIPTFWIMDGMFRAVLYPDSTGRLLMNAGISAAVIIVLFFAGVVVLTKAGERAV